MKNRALLTNYWRRGFFRPLSSSSQITECLKENKKQLSQVCHHKIFKLQETEMMDPELDYQLMRVCKQMIKVSCFSR